MKHSKVLPYFLLAVLLLSLISFFAASAHSGRTDANGGHWNHATGEYHYHSGEYAGKSSSSVKTKEYEYERFTPKYEPPAKQEIEKKTDDKPIISKDEITAIIIYLLVCGIPFWIVIIDSLFGWICGLFKKIFRKHR